MVFKFCITAFFLLMLCSGIPGVEFARQELEIRFWWIGWNWMGGLSPHYEIPVGVVLIGTYTSLPESWRWRTLSLSTPPACGRRENTPDAALGSGRRKKSPIFFCGSHALSCLWSGFGVRVGVGVGVGRGLVGANQEGLWRISFVSDTAFLLCYIFFSFLRLSSFLWGQDTFSFIEL